MSDLDNIISVTITRQTQSIATASFQIPMILSEHSDFVERSRTYTDITGVAADFAVSSVTYKIANLLFSQRVRPPSIVIGRKAPDPETYAEAFVEVEADNDSWYCLVSDTHEESDVLALAALIEARSKIYGTSTQDPDTPLAPTIDIGGQLNALGYGRTFIVYNTDADTEYPEAAWVGDQLPRTPGSNDWDKVPAAGITPDKLDATALTNLDAKSVNYYTSIANLSVFQKGNMVDGSYIDEQILVDWIVARMQEAIYFRMVNLLKNPFTKAGFTLIENEMRGVLAQAVANGGLANNPAPNVIAPKPLAIPLIQRNARDASPFKFTARFAGSTRSVGISGTLTA